MNNTKTKILDQVREITFSKVIIAGVKQVIKMLPDETLPLSQLEMVRLSWRNHNRIDTATHSVRIELYEASDCKSGLNCVLNWRMEDTEDIGDGGSGQIIYHYIPDILPAIFTEALKQTTKAMLKAKMDKENKTRQQIIDKAKETGNEAIKIPQAIIDQLVLVGAKMREVGG